MTFLIETVRLGLTNLGLHKLRSLLTALAIIFGVAAVILMVAIGEGSKERALASIRQLGARNIIVRSVKPTEQPSAGQSQRGMLLQYGLTRKDLARIEQTVDQIVRVVPMKRVARNVSRVREQVNAEVFGTMPQLLAVTRLEVARGRYLTVQDLQQTSNVAVLGHDVAERLFPLEDPLESWVRIQGQLFRVVGVLTPVEQTGTGTAQLDRDLDFDVHIPLTTAVTRFGDTVVQRQAGSMEAEKVELSELIIEVADESVVLPVADQISLIIDREHEEKGDVKMVVPLALLEEQKRQLRMFNYLMTAIASISLLVGGIGIMNIMLATVTERTREIGIRRAVGATRPHIVAQFLVETTLLSAAGGMLGVAIGLGGSELLAAWRRLLPPDMGVPQWTGASVIISFVVAAGVGIIFGLYPAVKASRQDPITALRHE